VEANAAFAGSFEVHGRGPAAGGLVLGALFEDFLDCDVAGGGTALEVRC
jgi:hypothetical protein